jgi:hypothetical protein
MGWVVKGFFSFFGSLFGENFELFLFACVFLYLALNSKKWKHAKAFAKLGWKLLVQAASSINQEQDVAKAQKQVHFSEVSSKSDGMGFKNSEKLGDLSGMTVLESELSSVRMVCVQTQQLVQCMTKQLGEQAELLRGVSEAKLGAENRIGELEQEVQGLNERVELLSHHASSTPQLVVHSSIPKPPLKLGVFDGSSVDGETFRDFIYNFRVVHECIGVPSSEWHRLFPAYLTGLARYLFRSGKVSELEKGSFEGLRFALERELGVFNHRKVVAKLSSCVQGPQESSVHFCDRLKGLHRAAWPEKDQSMLDDEVLDSFLLGVRPELGELFPLVRPGSLYDAVLIGSLAEDRIFQRQQSIGVAKPKGVQSVQGLDQRQNSVGFQGHHKSSFRNHLCSATGVSRVSVKCHQGQQAPVSSAMCQSLSSQCNPCSISSFPGSSALDGMALVDYWVEHLGDSVVVYEVMGDA